MNIRQLKCFRAVMMFGTTTEAAAALNLSQPAVSLAITTLEKQLGFQLFERIAGRLKPTREAQFLISDTDNTLGAFDRATQTARAIRARTHGNLVIACYPAIGLEFLPRVLTRFLKERPNVKVELHSRSSSVIHELLPAQNFDIAIADLPLVDRDISTRAVKLDCVCVLPRGSALARKRSITPEDLAGVPFFSLFKEHIIYNRVASAFAAANVRWNVVAECRFFASACAFVAQGWGASIVDAITARDFRGRNVVARPFLPLITYDIGIIVPLRRSQSAIATEFLRELQRQMQAYVGPVDDGVRG